MTKRKACHSIPHAGKIVCRFCEQEIDAGDSPCPKCGKNRLLGKCELRYIGRHVDDWEEYEAPTNSSMRRGTPGMVGLSLFRIDSGDCDEQDEERNR